jgi:host factor-I protein
MASELETGLPSIRLIQTFIREKTPVELKLVTNDLLTGTVVWQDPYCLSLVDAAEQPTLIWRSALAYIKAKS